MAEKKKGWFSRLFGGKKEEVVSQAAPEVVEEHSADTQAESPAPAQVSAPTKTDESSKASESNDVIAETIVEGISQEIDESIKHNDADDVTKHHDEQHSEHSAIKSQHTFLGDIVAEAKEEIEAAHHEIIEPALEKAEAASSKNEEAEKTNISESSEHQADVTPHDDIREDHISTKEVAAEEISLEYQSSRLFEAEPDTEESEESDDIPDNRADEIEASYIDPVASEVNEEAIVEEMPLEDQNQDSDTEIIDSPDMMPGMSESDADESVNTDASQVSETVTPITVTEEITTKEAASDSEQSAIIQENHKEIQEADATEVDTPEQEEEAPTPEKKKGFFARLSSKLSKTRNNITEGLADLFLGKKEINEEILEELETRLLMADVGITVTDQMLTSIRDSVSRKSLSNVDELFAALKVQMKDILEPVSKPLVIDTAHKPYVILMIGVNGVGKTTTIGKLAKKFQAEGKSVMLAAGDTFRAAAVEQLEIWGGRNKIPVISQKEGADPASVIFDAMESAKARKVDILIADTAGRLHTDSGLMQELGKINRVIKRHDETAPHEVMLVVDASTGQNALNQARQFNETVPLSGITFTKLDGTAKGGIIFAIADELNIPIRFIGVGESIDDLRPFDADEFVDALIETDTNN